MGPATIRNCSWHHCLKLPAMAGLPIPHGRSVLQLCLRSGMMEGDCQPAKSLVTHHHSLRWNVKPNRVNSRVKRSRRRIAVNAAKAKRDRPGVPGRASGCAAGAIKRREHAAPRTSSPENVNTTSYSYLTIKFQTLKSPDFRGAVGSRSDRLACRLQALLEPLPAGTADQARLSDHNKLGCRWPQAPIRKTRIATSHPAQAGGATKSVAYGSTASPANTHSSAI